MTINKLIAITNTQNQGLPLMMMMTMMMMIVSFGRRCALLSLVKVLENGWANVADVNAHN